MFAVSAQDYLSLLKGEETDVFTEKKQTGIPKLQTHVHKTMDKHNEAKVKEYVGPFFNFLIFNFLLFLDIDLLHQSPVPWSYFFFCSFIFYVLSCFSNDALKYYSFCLHYFVLSKKQIANIVMTCTAVFSVVLRCTVFPKYPNQSES